MKRGARLIGLFLLCTLPVVNAWATEAIRPFMTGSYQQIVDEHKGKAFMLVFWSLDCPSCSRELERLSQHVNGEKPKQVVLVSTDHAAGQQEVVQLLKKYKIQHADLWLFSDEDQQRLRYEIDNSWYGELPRSYLFDAAHQRRAISGLLPVAELSAWLEQVVVDR